MGYSDPTRRPLVIAGLRELADCLEANPELPAPYSTDVTTFVPKSADREMCAEVERVAHLLGTGIDAAAIRYGHYVTALKFGPAVQYRLVAILARARAEYAAWSSIRRVITPDAGEEV